ncbi:MAG TPA: PHP domain-containing protein [Gemmatimonadaceae bacterium]|nr:PHP domain-containing protein [Gemmatimonadaceae bacterium]
MTAPGEGSPRGGPFVDLHSHSTASDGALPPREVVAAARRAGLAAIALTDHDTLAGVPEAQAAGEELGVRVVAGAELSAHDGEKEVHLLALHLRDPARVDAELSRFRVGREARAAAIVEKLKANGLPVQLDDVLAAAGGGAVGRPHVARALIAAGLVRDNREAFDRWLGTGRPAYVAKELLPVREAARLVHEAGGLLVFAHPGADGSRERVERFVRDGLDGLEVRHPSHSAEDVARLTALADHFRLVYSGGSDWHGASEGPRTLGALQVPIAWLEQQDARVAARATAGA